MTVAIVGGGIMGITLGYFLARRDVEVEIFEASDTLGGLAGPLVLPDGTAIDRFYHAILSSDSNLRRLCEELDIEDQLRFRQTRMGFFHDGKIYSMNSTLEFLRFPPLGWIDRFRLGLTVLGAQFVSDWHQLEGVGVEPWLLKWSGRNTYENIWRPMLRAKFDGSFDDVPATFIWSRLVRMKSTRTGANQKEEAGHLIGGYSTLLGAMAEWIQNAGGKIHLSTPIQEIVIENNRAVGLRVGDELLKFRAIAATTQAPIFRWMIPSADPRYIQFLDDMKYLGVVCPLMVLDRPLTGYWTLNITDERIPFTGVIETTAYIDPQYVGGHHLVYLPKYTAPGSPLQKVPSEEIQKQWLEHLRVMFPDFDPDSIRYFLVHKERLVEPLHGLNRTDQIPQVDTPVEDLYLSTTGQIYPQLTNGESVTRHAEQTAEKIIARLAQHKRSTQLLAA